MKPTFLAGAFLGAALPFGFTTSGTLSDEAYTKVSIHQMSQLQRRELTLCFPTNNTYSRSLPISIAELADTSMVSAAGSALLAFLLFFRGFFGACLETFIPASLITLLFNCFLVSSARASFLSCSYIMYKN